MVRRGRGWSREGGRGGGGGLRAQLSAPGWVGSGAGVSRGRGCGADGGPRRLDAGGRAGVGAAAAPTGSGLPPTSEWTVHLERREEQPLERGQGERAPLRAEEVVLARPVKAWEQRPVPGEGIDFGPRQGGNAPARLAALAPVLSLPQRFRGGARPLPGSGLPRAAKVEAPYSGRRDSCSRERRSTWPAAPLRRPFAEGRADRRGGGEPFRISRSACLPKCEITERRHTQPPTPPPPTPTPRH